MWTSNSPIWGVPFWKQFHCYNVELSRFAEWTYARLRGDDCKVVVLCHHSGNTTSLQGHITNSASVIFDQDGSGVYLSVLSGSGVLTKVGSGTLTLLANNTYTGSTTVEAGKLVVNGSISSATIVRSGASLGGSGTIASATIQSGGTIDPGNSPGALTLTNGLTWSGGGNYNWQIFGVSCAAGATNTWDLIAVTGGMWDINGLSSTNKFNINLWSLSGLPETSGALAGFDTTQNYSWKILDSVGITGSFNTNLFNINTSAVNGTGGFVGATGLFALELNSNDLFLTYTGTGGAAVPEPGTWAAAALLALGAGYVRWKRRSCSSGNRHGCRPSAQALIANMSKNHLHPSAFGLENTTGNVP